MTPNEYQELAGRTLIDGSGKTYDDVEIMLVWNATGLAGEAGEVVEHIKKGVFHEHGIDVDKLADELGDVLWYVAAIATKLDVPLEYIMSANIDKLKKRYPGDWSPEDSRKRVDVDRPVSD